MAAFTLVVSCLTIAATIGRAGAEPCEVLTEANNPECYANVQWALKAGPGKHPEWYSLFPKLYTDSTMEDFQYFLSVCEDAGGAGKRWNCSRPCAMSADAKVHDETTRDALMTASCAAEAPYVSSKQGAASTTPAPSSPLKAWQWVLLVLGACCCLPLLGLACSALLCYETVSWIWGGERKRAPQTKRSVKVAVPSQELEAAPASPVLAQQAPLVTYQSYQPVTYVNPPVTYVAPPVYTAQPVTAPAQYVSVPVVQYATPAPAEQV